MDGGERRHPQYGQPYQGQDPSRQMGGQSMGRPTQDRYSQSVGAVPRTEMNTPSSARPYMPGYSYGYQDSQFSTPQMHSSSPMHGVQMQYTPSYVQEPQSRQQLQSSPSQQQYSSYAQGSMLPPMGQQSMYDSMPQYQQQRQNAAIEVMASQFGGIPSYMGGGVQHNVGMPTSAPYLVSQPEQSAYSTVAVTRPQLQQPFMPTSTPYHLLDHGQSQEQSAATNAADVLEDGRRKYEQSLKAVFEAIVSGRVSEAAEQLLPLSSWLVRNVRNLGLHFDDETHHQQRLLLWREFNHAWEALGQKQKSLTEDALSTRIRPSQILSADTITQMVDELIHLCDSIEKHGLVDYELGIWEEQIVGIFTQCLDLLESETTAQHTTRT